MGSPGEGIAEADRAEGDIAAGTLEGGIAGDIPGEGIAEADIAEADIAEAGIAAGAAGPRHRGPRQEGSRRPSAPQRSVSLVKKASWSQRSLPFAIQEATRRENTPASRRSVPVRARQLSEARLASRALLLACGSPEPACSSRALLLARGSPGPACSSRALLLACHWAGRRLGLTCGTPARGLRSPSLSAARMRFRLLLLRSLRFVAASPVVPNARHARRFASQFRSAKSRISPTTEQPMRPATHHGGGRPSPRNGAPATRSQIAVVKATAPISEKLPPW